MCVEKLVTAYLPLQADFEVADFGALRQFEKICKINSFLKDNIVNRTGLFVLEMAVIGKVWAVA
jgi:hypothetical protein